MADPKECFVISPIGAKKSATRQLADLILDHVIRPAVEPLGYIPLRADGIKAGGNINIQVIEHLLDAPLVIANLQENNANVYYEMASRHTTGKPLIPIAPTGRKTNLPFHVSDIRTVLFNSKDLGDADEAEKSIREQILEFEAKPQQTAQTPVSIVFNERDLAKHRDTAALIGNLAVDLRNQINQLHTLSDLTRKPLKGIPEILVECYKVLKSAKKGSRLWLVGMTLGIGPPHKYRNATPQAPSGSIDAELKVLWPECTGFDDLIDGIGRELRRIVADPKEPAAEGEPQNSTIVCLDQSQLRRVFLDRLALRPSYAQLKDQIDTVSAKVKTSHDQVAQSANQASPKRPVRYLSSLPLQLLIVDKNEEPQRRAALVFHVGSENLAAQQSEIGFYSEIDQVVDMFATMAESLYQTAAEVEARRSQTGAMPAVAPMAPEPRIQTSSGQVTAGASQ